MSLRTVESQIHQYIHLGQAFKIHRNSNSLGDGSEINIYFKTPASGNVPNVLFRAQATLNFDIQILEAPTVTNSSGTDGQIPIIRNRQSSNTSVIIDEAGTSNRYSIDVTTTANGTVLDEGYFGTSKVGGNYEYENEFVLKYNTVYVYKLISRAAANRVHFSLDWYENGA